MNQVYGVRNVCEKFEGNAANHCRVESRTKLEVTDRRTDGQTYRREVHCANSVLTLHCGVHHMNMDTIGGPPSEMMRGTLRGSTDKTLWLF